MKNQTTYSGLFIPMMSVLKSTKAAIDLASIMIGVIVIGIIGGVIAATVFAVIPWAQDEKAKADLDGVVTAESAYYGFTTDQPATGFTTATFADYEGLKKFNRSGSKGLLTASDEVKVNVSVDGKCYVGASKSATGKIFYVSNKQTKAREYKASTFAVENKNDGCVVGVDFPITNEPVLAYEAVTWKRLNAPYTNASSRYSWDSVSASDNARIIVASVNNNGGVFITRDSGANWSALSVPLQSQFGVYPAVTVSSDGTTMISRTNGMGQNGEVFISRDSGATWSTGLLGASNSEWVRYYQNVNISEDNKHIYMTKTWDSSGSARVIMSHDNGVTWTSKELWAGYLGNTTALTASADGKHVVVSVTTGTTSDQDRVWVSDDFGATFTKTNLETKNGSYNKLSSLGSSANGKIVYASFSDAVGQKSVDGGLTWTPMNRSVLDISVSDDGKKIVSYGTSGDKNSIIISTDGGTTWKAQNIGTLGLSAQGGERLPYNTYYDNWMSNNASKIVVGSGYLSSPRSNDAENDIWLGTFN